MKIELRPGLSYDQMMTTVKISVEKQLSERNIEILNQCLDMAKFFHEKNFEYPCELIITDKKP
jgi:hypothetical protein